MTELRVWRSLLRVCEVTDNEVTFTIVGDAEKRIISIKKDLIDNENLRKGVAPEMRMYAKVCYGDSNLSFFDFEERL